MDQQKILAMILNAKSAGKDENEIVEMLRAARDAQKPQNNPVIENPPESTAATNESTDTQGEDNCDAHDEPIDKLDDEIEWIFTDDDIPDQSGHGIEETPVSISHQPKQWEFGVDNPNTTESTLESEVHGPSELTIVKTTKLPEQRIKPKSTRKPYHQSPLSVLGSFVFLGAVIGVTVYQFFRLHPTAPNTAPETTVASSDAIAPDSSIVTVDETPTSATDIPNQILLPPTAAPLNSALPTGCGGFDGTREAHIEALKTASFVLADSFPTACQAQLDELQFKYAIEKLAANDGNFQAATTLICEVTESYFKTAQDPFSRPFFRDWAENNNQFKDWLEKYLTKTDCPAANYLQ
ncbi:MAG: hypothetical protein QNJ46_10490 [Leptolyngbyaceae cyanobacterium MO_188.B28]|nr:hypothetical protein [Leptolyngbyaceae cyanobacterium MO_188.B28]